MAKDEIAQAILDEGMKAQVLAIAQQAIILREIEDYVQGVLIERMIGEAVRDVSAEAIFEESANMHIPQDDHPIPPDH